MKSAHTSRLTERGRALLAAGATLAVAGVLLGFPDLTKVGLLALLLPALTRLLARVPPPRLVVARQCGAAPLTVGTSVEMSLRVSHLHGRPTPPLALSDPISVTHSTPTAVVPPLRRGHAATTSYTLTPPQRGELKVGPALGIFSDALGLCLTTWTMGAADTFVVMPRIHALTADPRSAQGATSEQVEHTHLGLRGDDDVSIRTYTEGDDLRRVHWPMTAHRGTLMVREEGRPSGRRALVLVDHRLPPSTYSSLHDSIRDLDVAVELAASVCSHLHRNGFTVTLATPDRLHLATPRSDSADLLRELALLPPHPPASASAAQLAHHFGMHGQHHGVAFVITTAALLGDLTPVLSARPSSTTGFLLVIDANGYPATTTHVDAARALAWHAGVCAASTDFAPTWSALLAQPAGSR